MLKHLQYHFQEGVTPLSAAELNRRFRDLDGRLHALEEMTVSWQEAVRQIQVHGLERINSVLQPVLAEADRQVDQARDQIQAVRDELGRIQADWQTIQQGWAGMQQALDQLRAELGAEAARRAADIEALRVEAYFFGGGSC